MWVSKLCWFNNSVGKSPIFVLKAIWVWVMSLLCNSLDIGLLKKKVNSLAHFLIGSFIFLELSCISCLYIFEMSCLSVVSFAIIFSHSEGCLFTLLIFSFVVQKLLILIRSHWKTENGIRINVNKWIYQPLLFSFCARGALIHSSLSQRKESCGSLTFPAFLMKK